MGRAALGARLSRPVELQPVAYCRRRHRFGSILRRVERAQVPLLLWPALVGFLAWNLPLDVTVTYLKPEADLDPAGLRSASTSGSSAGDAIRSTSGLSR